MNATLTVKPTGTKTVIDIGFSKDSIDKINEDRFNRLYQNLEDQK